MRSKLIQMKPHDTAIILYLQRQGCGSDIKTTIISGTESTGDLASFAACVKPKPTLRPEGNLSYMTY